MKKFISLLTREFLINFRNLENLSLNIFFYFIGTFVFIIAFGYNNGISANYGHAIIWTINLFTIILCVEQFFIEDFWDGSIKELQIIGFSIDLIILVKLIVMWCLLITPILIITPLLTLMLGIELVEIETLIISIALGSPSLLLIASLGVILTLQSKKNKLLLIILIFPFYIPILIFGVGSIDLVKEQLSPKNNFFILIGIFLITLPITLLAVKFALKEINK